jgi:16S rRNA (uracil1498-N3)-methyltransferase
VTSIVPVIARRTEKHLALAADKRVDRWRRVAREASEQARRVAPPEIADPVKFSAALEVASDLRIVLAETEREAQLSSILRERSAVPSLALAIGPEGGWTPDELHLFGAAGWIAASLGETILRAETAAIVGLAIAQAEMSYSV